MESLLWRLSPVFQVASALVFAAYFIARERSLRRPESHAWMIAWLANLAALVILVVFWPMPSGPVAALATAGYFFAKTQFYVLLVAGASRSALDKPQPVPHGRVSAAIGVFSVLCAIAIGSLDKVGMVQSIMTGATLLAGAIAVSRSKPAGWRWLATGFVLRMLLAAAETDGYAIQSLGHTINPGWFASFLRIHSVFDTFAEWIIALGCALTLRGRIAQPSKNVM